MAMTVTEAAKLLANDVKAGDPTSWRITMVNREALILVLEAHAAGIVECDRVIAQWDAHKRPKYLSWYDKDEESDNLSMKEDVARDVRNLLKGENT